MLLQILDDGVLTDSQGRKVDFKNCIIIMTSNVGVKKAQVDLHCLFVVINYRIVVGEIDEFSDAGVGRGGTDSV